VTLNPRMTLTAAVAVILTSTVIYPLFTDGSQWFWAGAGAVIVAAGCGALSRLRVLPVVVCLAISVVGLLLYLNLVFEGRHSWLRLIPTPTSVTRLFELVGTGLVDSHTYAPPAHNVPPLVLIAAGGIGITAIMTDLIAVRLRSAALAGLPLLVLFTVPVTMRAPVGIGTVIVFSLGTAGYLAILSADGRERIRVWGRLVSLWRSGPLDGGAARHAPGSGVAARNGSTGHGAATVPTAPAGGPGTGHRIGEPAPGPDTRALAAAGRRIGLASVILALCVPLIVPGLHPSKLFSSGPGIGGDGGDGGASGAPPIPGAWLVTASELKEPHPTEVLTYTTSSTPQMQEDNAEYLQQYVFDDLGDKGWVLDPRAGSKQMGPTMPQGLDDLSAAQQVTIAVNVDSGALSSQSLPTFLPIPYPPISVTTPVGSWLTDPDGMVFSQAYSVDVGHYQVESEDVDPTSQELADAPPPPTDLKADLELPASYEVRALKQYAEAVTKGRTTEYAKADALATFLSGWGGFTYSEDAPTFNNEAGLFTFLSQTRSGVCVQYAYAMTVLARLLGIPARMVEGYTAGTPVGGNKYVVKTSDAHAWTEVYFSGYGWIRFEPTPAGQGTAARPNYMGTTQGLGAGTQLPRILRPTKPTGTPNTGPSGTESGNLNKLIQEQGGLAGGPAGKSAGTPWAAIVLAVLAAIAVACGVVAIVAPSAHRVTSHPANAARRRRPVSLTSMVLVLAAAGVVALALYRLLAHTSGLDLQAGWATVGIAFGAACGVLLVVPSVGRIGLKWWRWMRAHDDVSRAHTAWREFRDDLEDFGVGCRPSEPPRSLAHRITPGLPEPAGAAVRRLAIAEERASYAASPSEAANLRRDGKAARRGIAASVRRGARWRARIFPASVITAIVDAAAQIPDRVAALVSRRWTERRSTG
jgi:TgpA N-terminal domain/Transglutaminase-like superfamily